MEDAQQCNEYANQVLNYIFSSRVILKNILGHLTFKKIYASLNYNKLKRTKKENYN
jgi:hypothetical protein